MLRAALAVFLVAGFPLEPDPSQVDDTFWSFLPKGQAVTRCGKKADREAAKAAWEAIDGRISSVRDDSDVSALRSDLKAMFRSSCLFLGAENGPLPAPTHALSLKTWWEDGGRWWIWNLIEPSEEGPVSDLREVTVLPPTPRRVLFRETSNDAALSPILCSQSEPACGAETEGWRARAELALQATAVRPLWFDEEPKPSTRDRCDGETRGVAKDRAYTTWRDCLEAHVPPDVAFPLGRFRAPTDGWLYLSGRRGHYTFCDGAAAYDLRTGTAYRWESCSALALLPGGSVDVKATNANRKETPTTGHVPTGNIAEAVWMLLLTPRVEAVRAKGQSFPVPRNTPVRYSVQEYRDPMASTGMTGSTAQTMLSWTWLGPDGRQRAAGEVTWPESFEPAEAHAARLIDIAERGLVAECPAVALPEASLEDIPPAFPDLATFPEFKEVQQHIEKTRRSDWLKLRELAPATACPAQPPQPAN